MDYYNPFYEIFKDNRLIFEYHKIIGDKMLIWASLKPLKIVVCPKCGSINVIKYGTKERTIKDKVFREYKTELYLTIQKFRCNDCNSMFQDKSTIVDDNCNISKRQIRLILEELRADISESLVATMYDTTSQTVFNIFESYVKVKRHELPEVLCIDEFKNFVGADGSFACVLFDPVNKIVIDVIENRLKPTLVDYFYGIDYKERANVKYFVSDMYEGYRSIKKEFFPKSTHVIDAFHYASYVTDALNSIRIKVQNSYDTNTCEYRLYKKYWELFLKPVNEVKEFYSYNPYRKRRTSSWDIINDGLQINEHFNNAYSLKEDFYCAYDSVKYEYATDFIDDIIKSFEKSEIDEFIKVSKTFSNWKTEIINSFIRFGDRRLHNGYIEGMINKIKTIKKISYGYSSFYHFRNRIMFVINPNEPISKEKITLIPRIHRKRK